MAREVDKRATRLVAQGAWAEGELARRRDEAPAAALRAALRAARGEGDSDDGPSPGAPLAALAAAADALLADYDALVAALDAGRGHARAARVADYDARRDALPLERETEACAFDDSALHEAHGGPASNAHAARGAPDPVGKAAPLLRTIAHRYELPELLRGLGLDRGSGAELGVWRGKFSAHLLRSLPDLETLYLVDAWDVVDIYQSKEAQDDAFAVAAAAAAPFANAKILRNWTHDAARGVPDASLDFVYVDASHDYRNSRADLMDWWPKVRVGGLFAGNDYFNGYVPVAGYTFGVKDAVDEFAAVRDLRVHVTRENDPDGAAPDWFILKCAP